MLKTKEKNTNLDCWKERIELSGEKKFSFSKGNHKLSRNVLVWNLPRLKTCPGAGECKKYCYEIKTERMYRNAVKSRERNFLFSKTEDFVPAVVKYLKERKESVVRIHASGDFFSQSYLDKWKTIAKELNNKTFYAYTKSFHLDFSGLPKNFVVLQSYGSRFDDKIDATKNTARVIEKEEDLKPNEFLCPYHQEDFTKCAEFCKVCLDTSLTVRHVAFLKH